MALGDLRASIVLGADELAFEQVAVAGDLLTGRGRIAFRLQPGERGEVAAEGRIDSLDLARAAEWAGHAELGLVGRAAGEFHLAGPWHAPSGEVTARSPRLQAHGISLEDA